MRTPLLKFLAVIIAVGAVNSSAFADTLATPVVNKQGTTLAVTVSGGGGAPTTIIGLDGGYPAKVDQGAAGAAAWKVDGSGVTQPVSGTFWQSTQPVSIAGTVNTSDAHTSAINSLACQLTDGAAFYKGPTTAQLPAALDGSGFLKTHEQGTATVSGTVTATQATGSNLHVVVDTAPTTTVTGTVAATQSGGWTVTANSGSNLNTSALALDSTVAKDATVAKLTLGQASTTAAQTGPLVQGAVTASAPSYTTAQTDPLSLTAAGALRTDASATTQPVSGTVTANAGSNLNTSALALDATLTGGTQTTRITDGTNTATVKAASTPAAATDKSLVVALNPNSPLGAGSAVIGHVIVDTTSTTAVTQATAANLNATVVQATGTNLHAVLDTTSTTAVTQGTAANLNALVAQGAAGAAAWKVDGSAVTQPVSTADTAPVNQALGALNAACTITMAGQASVGFQLAAGTLVGTIIPEISHDNGVTYNATFFDDPATGNKVSSVVFGSANTATDRTIVGAGGQDHVRVRVSAYTSGTAGCLIRGSATSDPSLLFTAAAGAPAPIVGQVGGKDGSGNVQALVMKAGSTAAAAGDISAVVAVSPNSPLPAGSNVIGHVIADTGSTTAVTGNVTVVQPTGTNLHAVLDTTSTTAVTQATGTNLHAVLDTTSTTACTQATGTNLHVVTDATSVLAANQSVNMAQVAGTNTVSGGVAGTQGVGGVSATNSAITQNPVLIGVEVNSGQPAAATTGNQRQMLGSLDGVVYTRPGGPVLWHCSLTGIAATLTQCQAAPTAGLSLYITAMFIQTTTATAGTYALQAGTGANCVTGTTAIFPASGTANRFTAPINTAGLQQLDFLTPIKLTAANALCLIGTATNTIDVEALGFTAP